MKQTFALSTFRSKTFACGTFAGVGVTPPTPAPVRPSGASGTGGGGPFMHREVRSRLDDYPRSSWKYSATVKLSLAAESTTKLRRPKRHTISGKLALRLRAASTQAGRHCYAMNGILDLPTPVWQSEIQATDIADLRRSEEMALMMALMVGGKL